MLSRQKFVLSLKIDGFPTLVHGSSWVVAGKAQVNKLSAEEQVWWDRSGARVHLDQKLKELAKDKENKSTASKRPAGQNVEESPKAKREKNWVALQF